MKSFWKRLKSVQAGPNPMGQIALAGTYLQAELNAAGTNRGLIRVKATPLPYGGNGYTLTETSDYGPDVAEVYWLPWKNNEATVGARTAYENSKRDIFFMTTTMSGCRFSVGDDLVIHTAHSAGYNSAGRSQTEEAITGPRGPSTRRLSVSAPSGPNDLQYGGRFIGAYSRALVFGMQGYQRYTYKVLNTANPPGTWEILL